jgi:hypothetical protein
LAEADLENQARAKKAQSQEIQRSALPMKPLEP